MTLSFIFQTVLYTLTTSFYHVDIYVIYCMVFVLNTLFCCLWDEQIFPVSYKLNASTGTLRLSTFTKKKAYLL